MLKHTAVAAAIGLALVAPAAAQAAPDPGTKTTHVEAAGQKHKRALKKSKHANKRAKHHAKRHHHKHG